MTTFHDQLADSVGDVHAEPAALVIAARSRSLAHRRQRRALAAVGAVAAAVIAGSVVHAVAPRPSPASPVVATDPGAEEAGSESGDPLVALDGRATAGLLASAVEAQGLVATSSRGQGAASAASGETYAEVSTAGGQGTTIGVNVQHVPVSSDPTELVAERRDDGKVGTDRWIAVRTEYRRGIRVAVQLVVAEGTAPPLTTQQLTLIAADPSWSFLVPLSAADVAPEPYTSLGR